MRKVLVFLAVGCCVLGAEGSADRSTRSTGAASAEIDNLPEIAMARSGHRGSLRPPGAGTSPLGEEPSFGTAQPDHLASGAVVNFESPPVAPLALSEDGALLYVANTPAGTLDIFELEDGAPTLSTRIPVGLDPVTVAAQPNAATPTVWVANLISDSVAVVDVERTAITAILPTDDEPVNILFDDAGETAFVLCQSGSLLAIDTATHVQVGRIELDAFGPRAMTWRNGELAIAALHSGNNTTVVGTPTAIFFEDRDPEAVSGLAVARVFEATAELFEDPILSPWPDPPTQIEEESPLVLRIVADAGVTEGNPWHDIIAQIDDGTGAPDPQRVAELETQAESGFGLTITNVEEIFQAMIDEFIDTRDHDVLLVDVTDPTAMTVREIVGDVGTTLHGIATDPATGDLLVTNLEALNRTRLEPNLRGHFVDHEIVRLQELGGGGFSVDAYDLHAGVPGDFNDVSFPNLDAQAASLAHPVDVAVHPDGSRLYVASLGTDRVGVLDAATHEVVSVTDVGQGPRALLLDAAGDTLYTYNRTDQSITALDVSTSEPAIVSTVALPNPEPIEIYQARRFLYSARFSNNYGSSCAMCHIDGGRDHLAWDLGDPGGVAQPSPKPFEDSINHPVKGPMVTQPLVGLFDHRPYHWRGDRPSFTDFNPAYDALLGGTPLAPDQIAAFEAFVETIVYPPNPLRARDNSFLDPRGAAGESFFLGDCNSCHTIAHDGALRDPDHPEDGDLAGRNNGNPEFRLTQTQVVRQMRGLYKKVDADLYTGFGLLHDGRIDRGPETHVVTRFHSLFGSLTNDEILDLTAFVPAFPTNVMPVVGWQILPESPVTVQNLDDIDLMLAESLASPSRCDVIFQGIGDGIRRSGVFVGTSVDDKRFELDSGAEWTLADILGRVENGGKFVFTAVPPGSGRRIAFHER